MASYHHAALATVGVCPAAQKPCATRRATQALCPETNEACSIRQPPHSWCVALWLKCRSRRAERAMAQGRRYELSSHGVHLHPCSCRTWFEQNCMGNKQPRFEPGQRAKEMIGGKVSNDRKHACMQVLTRAEPKRARWNAQDDRQTIWQHTFAQRKLRSAQDIPRNIRKQSRDMFSRSIWHKEHSGCINQSQLPQQQLGQLQRLEQSGRCPAKGRQRSTVSQCASDKTQSGAVGASVHQSKDLTETPIAGCRGCTDATQPRDRQHHWAAWHPEVEGLQVQRQAEFSPLRPTKWRPYQRKICRLGRVQWRGSAGLPVAPQRRSPWRNCRDDCAGAEGWFAAPATTCAQPRARARSSGAAWPRVRWAKDPQQWWWRATKAAWWSRKKGERGLSTTAQLEIGEWSSPGSEQRKWHRRNGSDGPTLEVYPMQPRENQKGVTLELTCAGPQAEDLAAPFSTETFWSVRDIPRNIRKQRKLATTGRSHGRCE